MKPLYLLMTFAACIISYGSSAQSEVKGKIILGTEPVSRASVSLNGRHQLTDSSGSFYFGKLAPGKYTLHVSVVGNEPYHQNIHLDQTQTKELLIELKPLISSLDAVVVSGTMKAVKRLESPIAVEVYSPQFFRKNPAPSVFESLQNVNGVRPQINCSVCNTGDIHINGLEGPYTMVTIDGMPIVSSLSSVYGLFGIPSELIERVEIVKGPASGLYGSEAIGGLINIITKSPQKAPLFSGTVMSTSWMEHNIDAGLKWKINERLQSLVGINYFNSGRSYDKNNDGFTDATLQHRISVFNKWNLHRNQNRIASLAGRYFYEDRWGGDMRWSKEFRGTDSIYGESIYTRRWELIGNYQLPLTEKLFFSFSATGHRQDSYYGTVPYKANQQILFGQMIWEKNAGNQHNLLAGLTVRKNYYDDNSTATLDTATKENRPERTFIPGLFLQDEWKINGDHTFLGGIRIDYHKTHGFIFTPRFAYKWRVQDNQTLRINAGTGFRVVNLFTEDHAALTGARAVEILEKLKPEKSYNVNVNYNINLGKGSKSVTLDASAWYSYFKNQIIADYETDPRKIIYKNLKGYSTSKGFTLNLEAHLLQRLKVLAGITVQDIQKTEVINSEKINQRPLLTESWSGTWSVSYSLPVAGITIDYTGNIYGTMRLPLLSSLDPRRQNSPVWSIQNVQFTKWISKKIECFAGIKNLLNWTPAKGNPFLIPRTNDPFNKHVQYDTNGTVVPTADNPYALTFDPSYIYAPNQGLRFFAGMRVVIK